MKKSLLLLAVIPFLLCFTVLSRAAEEKRYDVPVGDSPILGPATAPVMIIEFLDFQ